jgi:hypothetical protein
MVVRRSSEVRWCALASPLLVGRGGEEVMR